MSLKPERYYPEKDKLPRINTPEGYLTNDDVGRLYLSLWGCPDDKCAGKSPLLSEASGCLDHCNIEYLVTSSERIAREKKGLPYKSIYRRELQTQFSQEIQRGTGAMEIQQPLGYYQTTESDSNLPERSTFFLDFEHYHHFNPTWAYEHPKEVFQLLDGTYRAIVDFLIFHRLDAAIVFSGRGLHVVGNIFNTGHAMPQIRNLGYRLSKEVLHFLDNPLPDSKRVTPIHPDVERVYWGLRQIELYAYTQIMSLARNYSPGINIEFSDRGLTGISFDPTSICRNTETGTFGTPGAFYLKSKVKYGFPGRYQIRTVRAAVLDGRLYEFGDWDTALKTRDNYQLAAENARWLLNISPIGLPDMNQGLLSLLDQYQDSRMRQIHLAMDERYRLPQHEWEWLIGDLGRAAMENPEAIGDTAANPNPKLLNPDSLTNFIYALYERWKPHFGLDAFKKIEFILSAFYHNNRDIMRQFNLPPVNYVSAHKHEVPQRAAEGWTRTIAAYSVFSQHFP